MPVHRLKTVRRRLWFLAITPPNWAPVLITSPDNSGCPYHEKHRCTVFIFKVDKLKAEVKSATIELGQIEGQLSQGTSRKTRKRTTAPAMQQHENHLDIKSPSGEKEFQMSRAQGKDAVAGDTSTQAWYKLQVLRAQLKLLVEDLERSNDESVGDTLDDPSVRLRAACWQWCNEASLDDASGQEGVVIMESCALELASLAVAVDFTSCSGLIHELESALFDSVRTGGTRRRAVYSEYLVNTVRSCTMQQPGYLSTATLYLCCRKTHGPSKRLPSARRG